MKKEVGLHFMYFVIYVLVMVFLSFSVFAATGIGASGDADSGSERVLIGSAVTEEATQGYWIGVGKTQPIGGEVETIIRYGYSSSGADHSVRPSDGNTASEGWGVILDDVGTNNIFDYFGVRVGEFTPYNFELQKLVFVLDIDPFKVDDDPETLIFPSHGYTASKEVYEGGIGDGVGEACIKCDSGIDFLNRCTDGIIVPLPYPASCITIDILNRESCQDMADLTPNFCEGVKGVGANAGIMDPATEGYGGLGGCQPLIASEGEDLFFNRDYSRDWYNHTPPGGFLSDDFTGDPAVIGPCCGNDLEDIGALAKHATDFTSYPNTYICANLTAEEIPVGSGSIPGFSWVNAQDTNFLYKIIPIRKGEQRFDAFSDGNNWMICDTLGGLEDIYDGVDMSKTNWRFEDGGGALLSEYDSPLNPAERHSEDMETPDDTGGSGSSGDGDFVDSSDDSDDPSRSDIFLEDDFVSSEYKIIGDSVSDNCDLDGDGYDGAWNVLFAEYPGETPCTDPQGLVDCDDDSRDDPEGIPLAYMKHPGAIDYCQEGVEPVDQDLDCNAETNCIPDTSGSGSDEDTGSLVANLRSELLVPRLICHNVDEYSEFAECCGWDYANCNNDVKQRRTGSAVHTLREFDNLDDGSRNHILRFAINKPNEPFDDRGDERAVPYSRLILPVSSNDLGIKDWTHYKNLEFYIWFTTNFELEMWLGKLKGIDGVADNSLAAYMFPFKTRVVDYVVNEPELNKWLHVVIPTSLMFETPFEPDAIFFAAHKNKLFELGDSVTNVPGFDGYFSNVVGIDKIFLRPVDEGDNQQNFWCSGTWPPKWVSDLDYEDDSGLDSPVGKAVCESIPSYGWTGSECCGDDTGSDVVYDSDHPESAIIGPLTQTQEFYADSEAGCWAGNKLIDNSRAMIVQYGLYHQGFEGIINRTCTSHNCLYSLPAVDNVFVTNEHPGLYDLEFTSGSISKIRKGVGAAAVAPTAQSSLKANNIPLQVLYLDDDFWGCNVSDYMTRIPDQLHESEFLLDSENTFVSEGDTCAIKGKYFCDHSEGANLGWVDEPVIAYPTDEEGGGRIYVIMNITEDGEEEEVRIVDVSSEPTSSVPSNMREFTKRNYNLVKNGGFENV